MNLSQSKLILEKVIALYKNMSADEKNISSIERDLMLSYIKQLYESFLDMTPSVATQPKSAHAIIPPQPKVETPKPPVQPPPTHYKPVEETPKYVQEPPKQPEVETPRVYEQPRVVTPPPPPPIIEHPKPTHVDRPISVGSIPSEISVLFEHSTGRELSDKLANTPISDLTKAFGLNDRLLTINELFAGNKAVFDEAVKDLNGMSGFDTAKSYLLNIAVRNNWSANEDRKKQALVFIKMVRRRFH
jgi:hypothetical protein